ncbi:hypothetical protein DFP74_3731 [Nocardiopsis sp. Huas11]|uniref:hypothetical protein n=1 Tax=Nocardiopsis sp. Huas11 TaxID=2183912 RepID=UPI000EAE617C|nr:hypothetical protein [Nocardiopsis sp. Huas11]RKS08043.1 hypothetical protein DFP74_3731 [Nocardiopsis sp. Huas11]
MDVTGWLLARARPCAFVVAAVGGTGARLAVERQLRERGWRQAAAPGEADLLVVCGSEDPELADAVERVWAQMPGPRARVRVAGSEGAAALLDSARARLLDVDRQRREAAERDADARARVQRSDGDGEHESPHDDGRSGEDEHDRHGGGENGSPHERSDHSDGHGRDGDDGPDGEDSGHEHHDQSGGREHDHGHHDHGGMSMPGGIPMADRGPDRDGLRLDRLHVSLGPALADWPAGLCLRLILQGDVVQEAKAVVVCGSATPSTFWDVPGPAADLDSAQRLLAVAGWPSAAVAGRRWRDALLTEPDPSEPTRRGVLRWLRRVRRSRVLRWSTGGLGRITGPAPDPLLGDVTDRWSRRLDRVEAAVGTSGMPSRAERDTSAGRAEAAEAAVDLLPSLVTGQELAAVRLIVASLDPDLAALRAHAPGRTHG